MSLPLVRQCPSTMNPNCDVNSSTICLANRSGSPLLPGRFLGFPLRSPPPLVPSTSVRRRHASLVAPSFHLSFFFPTRHCTNCKNDMCFMHFMHRRRIDPALLLTLFSRIIKIVAERPIVPNGSQKRRRFLLWLVMSFVFTTSRFTTRSDIRADIFIANNSLVLRSKAST